MRSLLRAALPALLAVTAAAQTPDYIAQGKLWWSHIQYLAGDELRGRQTGSPGYDQGAAYVVAHFKQYGLQPAGTQGFLQPVNFDTTRTLPDQSSADLICTGPCLYLGPPQKAPAQKLAIGPDILLSSRLTEPALIDAPMVFIG